MTRQMTGALAALALLAAGCGGSDEGGGAATSAAAPAGGGLTIQMKGIAYEPREAEVAVGETVRWVNEDTAPHDVVSTSGPKVKSEVFGKGGSFEYTAKEAGTIEYYCSIHPNMTAKLTVTG